MIPVIFIILLSVLIFQNTGYWFLLNFLNLGYSYAFDQLLPLVITSIIAVLVVKKYIPITTLKRYLKINLLSFLIVVIFALVVHGLTLGNYFFGEEPSSLLQAINENSIQTPVGNIWRGWHIGVYVLLYQLFYTNVIMYNVIILLIYTITSVILYFFLNQLFKNKIIPSLVGTLFFITTPAYADIFSWQMQSSGMSLALSAGMLSLIFLQNFQKNNNVLFYLISLLFYLSMVKISFVRFFPFIALHLFICLFPLFKQVNWPNIKKYFLQASPFLLIFLSYLFVVFIFPDHVLEKLFPQFFPNSQYTGLLVTVRGYTLNTEGYLYVLAMFIAYLFIPSQLAADYYPIIRDYLFNKVEISFTFLAGLFCTALLLIIGLVALKNIRKIWGQVIVLSLITIFSHIVLTPLFIEGYNNLLGLDIRFSQTGAGNGPGIRYVFVSAFGFSILIAAISFFIIEYKKKLIGVFLVIFSVLIVYYSYLDILNHFTHLINIHPGTNSVLNGVFALVPNDNKQKLLLSTNPEKNVLDIQFGNFINAFYNKSELKYIKSYDEARELIKKGLYEKNNFYAFYNNVITQTFKNVSDLTREELYDGKISQESINLIQDVNLSTAFVETNNPKFPFFLNRGIYVLEDINKRLLSSRRLYISMTKKHLPRQFPYIDAYKEEQNTLPISIWDLLENRPFLVGKELNMPLSVASLDKRPINTLPSNVRIKLARDLVDRELIQPHKIQIPDIDKKNKHYIDSQEILEIFLNSPSFNSLGLIYICAEDTDWEKQKKSELAIGGIWYIKELPLNTSLIQEDIYTSMTCFGSLLRKVVLIGPPFPSNITIKKMSLDPN